MDIKRLTDEINEICQELDDTYDINAGGCCFIAEIISKNFERLGIKYKLGIVDADERSLIMRKNIKNRIDAVPNINNTRSHYFIYLTKYKIALNKGCFGRSVNYISYINSEDIAWIYKTGSWNSCYKTRHNNFITDKLNSIFKRHERT